MKRTEELDQVRKALAARYDLERTRGSMADLVADLISDNQMLRGLGSHLPTALNPQLRAKAERQRAGSSTGGKKGAATRDLKAIELEKVMAAARRMGFPAVTDNVVATLAAQFDRSTRRIQQILKVGFPAK